MSQLNIWITMILNYIQRTMHCCIFYAKF